MHPSLAQRVEAWWDAKPLSSQLVTLITFLLAVGLSMLQAWLKNPILAAKLDPDRPRRSRRPIKREKRESTQAKGNSLDNPSDQENTSE